VRARIAAGVLAVALAGCHQNFAKNDPYVNPSASGGVLSLNITSITTSINASAVVDGLVTGPDGRLWFTQTNTAQIGATTAAGAVQQFQLVASSGYTCIEPQQIIVGPDKNLWSPSYCGQLIRLTTAGAITVFPISSSDSFTAIVTGPDSNLWMGDTANGAIDVVSTSGVLVRTIRLPSGSIPSGLALGSDDNVWVADSGLGVIERVTVSGSVTPFSSGIPSGAQPRGIIGAPDGNLYFTLPATASTSDQIGRITTNGSLKILGTLTAGASPANLCVGPGGNVWFRENSSLANALGVVTLSSGALTEYTLTGIASPNYPDDGAGNGTDFVATFGSNLALGGTGAIYIATP
jgi:virginiamycin B lyase